jgi:type IV secretion system protein VirD4
VFQSVGQIQKHYGIEGVQTFLGAAVVQQWFGIRDHITALALSQSLGNQTLSYAPELDQAAARRTQARIARECLLGGADIFDSTLEYAHQARAAQNSLKIARALATPDEILRMPRDRQIVRVSGMGPVAAYLRPYYAYRFMAGQFAPNPLHPPVDRVRVATWRGMRWRRVITEPVPIQFRDWPQYRKSGMISYIEGYRPF